MNNEPPPKDPTIPLALLHRRYPEQPFDTLAKLLHFQFTPQTFSRLGDYDSIFTIHDEIRDIRGEQSKVSEKTYERLEERFPRLYPMYVDIYVKKREADLNKKAKLPDHLSNQFEEYKKTGHLASEVIH